MTQEKHEVECGLWTGGKLVKLRPVWGNQEAKQLSAVTFLLLNCNFTKSGLGISPAGSAPSTGVQQEHERLPALRALPGVPSTQGTAGMTKEATGLQTPLHGEP